MRIPGIIRAMYWRRRLARCDVRPWEQLPIAEAGDRPSVAIIGNAGYLSQTQLGERIDTHDVVVRMNDFQTAGFEHAVGRKADLLVASFAEEIQFDSPQLRTPRWVVSSMPPNFSKDPSRGLLFRHGVNIASGLTRMRRQTVFVPGIEYYAALHARLGAMPSTGAMAILLITKALADQVGDVFIAGFSFFEGQAHYYDNRVLDAAHHAMSAEKEMLREHLGALIRQGRVTLDLTMARHMR
jgi:hypothetical protein